MSKYFKPIDLEEEESIVKPKSEPLIPFNEDVWLGAIAKIKAELNLIKVGKSKLFKRSLDLDKSPIHRGLNRLKSLKTKEDVHFFVTLAVQEVTQGPARQFREWLIEAFKEEEEDDSR